MTNPPPNWVFSMFSFIGFILCCIPFPWHLAAWNTGTCLYMAWAGSMCLVLFINSIVWHGNVTNWAPVWCDITARMYVALDIAIPAACLCIARRLYRIAAVRNVIITKAEKRQAILIDLSIGVGLPVLGMILQYIPQAHRFDIFEDIGCFPVVDSTIASIMIISVPPILIGCIAAIYAVLGVLAFNRSRKQYNELLSGSHLTNHRYVRLMCLTGFGSVCTVSLGSYALYRNVSGGVLPWPGWAATHANFSNVDQYPGEVWRSLPDVMSSLELSRWFNVLDAFTFFAFFGFAEEARRSYSSAAQTFAKRVGISYSGSFGSVFSSSGSKTGVVSTAGGPSLPIFTRRTTRKSDFDSISNMSVSTRDVDGALSDEKEKPFSPDLSYGAMSLADVGGVLADYKADTLSPTPTSGSSSNSSFSSPTITASVRRLDADGPVTAAVPEPMLHIVSIPGRSANFTPSGARRNSHDMV